MDRPERIRLSGVANKQVCRFAAERVRKRCQHLSGEVGLVVLKLRDQTLRNTGALREAVLRQTAIIAPRFEEIRCLWRAMEASELADSLTPAIRDITADALHRL